MQNPIQKFRQSSTVFEKPGILSENLKNECVETKSFYIFIDNSRSKQNKKNPRYPFVDIGK